MSITLFVREEVALEGSPATAVGIGGRLDSETARRLAAEIEPVLARRPQLLVFDPAGLDFLTSAGIGEFFRVQKSTPPRPAGSCR